MGDRARASTLGRGRVPHPLGAPPLSTVSGPVLPGQQGNGRARGRLARPHPPLQPHSLGQLELPRGDHALSLVAGASSGDPGSCLPICLSLEGSLPGQRGLYSSPLEGEAAEGPRMHAAGVGRHTGGCSAGVGRHRGSYGLQASKSTNSHPRPRACLTAVYCGQTGG